MDTIFPLELSVGWVLFLAAVVNVLTQVLKKPIPEESPVREYIPVILFALITAVGLGLAAARGRDLVVGAFEGFFGAAVAMGFYKLEKTAFTVLNRR